MNPADLELLKLKLPLSKSTLELNSVRLATEAGPPVPDPHNLVNKGIGKAKRIRQSSKPLLNGLESEFFETIRYRFPNGDPVKPQAIKLKLGNNVFYKPDLFCASWPETGKPTCWECKCFKGKNVDRGKLVIKVAAAQWPEFAFVLVWKDKESGQWREQIILP